MLCEVRLKKSMLICPPRLTQFLQNVCRLFLSIYIFFFQEKKYFSPENAVKMNQFHGSSFANHNFSVLIRFSPLFIVSVPSISLGEKARGKVLLYTHTHPHPHTHPHTHKKNSDRPTQLLDLQGQVNICFFLALCTPDILSRKFTFQIYWIIAVCLHQFNIL